jgi:hypothetical protein
MLKAITDNGTLHSAPALSGVTYVALATRWQFCFLYSNIFRLLKTMFPHYLRRAVTLWLLSE